MRNKTPLICRITAKAFGVSPSKALIAKCRLARSWESDARKMCQRCPKHYYTASMGFVTGLKEAFAFTPTGTSHNPTECDTIDLKE